MISKEAVGNSWDILNVILSHLYHLHKKKRKGKKGFISDEWIQSLQQKWVLLQPIKGEIAVHDQLFCRHQHWRSLHGVTRKLDLDQTSVARKHTERQMWKNSLLNQASWLFTPISNKCVVIMFVLVCLCRFLWQIILLTYMS